MRDLLTNYATTTLLTGIAATDLSFVVVHNGGQVFAAPSLANPGILTVLIDNELITIGTIVADTFTIVARGAEGTTPAAHASGVTVQCVITAGMLDHLWRNIPDRFNPDVPPAARGLTPSAYDDEFETNSGLWTIIPSDTILITDYGVTTFSYLRLTRSAATTTLYTLTQALPLHGAFTVMVNMQHALPWLATSGTGSVLFFVSDQLSPSGVPAAGNRVGLRLGIDLSQSVAITTASGIVTSWPTPVLTAEMLISSVGPTTLCTVQDVGYIYFQLHYDGVSHWTCAASLDGVTYATLAQPIVPLLPQTCGFQLAATGSATLGQTMSLDWFRVTQP